MRDDRNLPSSDRQGAVPCIRCDELRLASSCDIPQAGVKYFHAKDWDFRLLEPCYRMRRLESRTTRLGEIKMRRGAGRFFASMDSDNNSAARSPIVELL